MTAALPSRLRSCWTTPNIKDEPIKNKYMKTTIPKIGAQLWLFRDTDDEAAMRNILVKLADAGYEYVETLWNKPPTDRATSPLPCYAAHIALSAMPPVGELVAGMRRLDANVVCVSGLLQWNERSPDDYRRSADALNRLGTTLRAEGIELHYHNHDFEFAAVDGAATGMDLLLGTLDVAVVPLCFDTGWAALAGHSPADFLDRNASRIGTLHLRDFRESVSVPLGAGSVAQDAIVEQLPSLPYLKAVLIEQDPGTQTPVQDMITSRQFLRERFGI